MPTAPTPNDALLMRFQPTDTATKVSRATLTRLAKQLGYKRESEVLHFAVRKLADEVLPTYEADDGPLSARQLAAIRKAAGAPEGGKVLSSHNAVVAQTRGGRHRLVPLSAPSSP